jgi:hypothetical protein
MCSASGRRAAGDRPEGLRDLFVAVMIWGSGTTNGRAPRYTGAALGDPRLPGVLDTTRDAVRAGELGRAYAEFRVRGVGRSFFTCFWRGCPGVHAGEESPPAAATRSVAASAL